MIKNDNTINVSPSSACRALLLLNSANDIELWQEELFDG